MTRCSRDYVWYRKRQRHCIPASIPNCAVVAVALLAAGSANAKDDEWRWRVFDREGEALLAIGKTDGATDYFGLPIFSCKDKSGNVSVEGEAKESLRVAMADLIQIDEAPWIEVMPDSTPPATTIDLFYSMIDGWRYKFDLSADYKSFEQFMQNGVIEFKLGQVTVHEEFKVGLESITEFFNLCKRQSNERGTARRERRDRGMTCR